MGQVANLPSLGMVQSRQVRNLLHGLICAGLLLLIGLIGCGGSGPAEGSRTPVLIFAAASTSNAIDDIKAKFHEQNGAEVRTSYAASSTLAQQIMHGADADLFLSADGDWANFVKQNTAEGQRKDLLGNRLVVIVPSASALKIHELIDLTAQTVEHVAVGDPASVPIGKYAKRALTKAGVWDKLAGKIVAGADVRQALALVETGAAEAGIVYSSDAAVSSKVKVAAEVPVELTGPVRYPLVLLRHGAANPDAEAFYRYLASPAAAQVFEKYGFTVLSEPAKDKP